MPLCRQLNVIECKCFVGDANEMGTKALRTVSLLQCLKSNTPLLLCTMRHCEPYQVQEHQKLMVEFPEYPNVLIRSKTGVVCDSAAWPD